MLCGNILHVIAKAFSDVLDRLGNLNVTNVELDVHMREIAKRPYVQT